MKERASKPAKPRITKARTELSIQGCRFYPIAELDTGKGPLWLPSVTTHLETWPKPALITWAAKSEKDGILGELEAWLHDDETASRGAMLDRILKMREAPLCYRETSRSAKDLGSSAHAWLEWHIRKMLGVDLGPEPALIPGADRAVNGAMAWMEEVSLKPLDVERRVYDAKNCYAGRYDVKAEIDWREGDALDGKTDRRVVIVDWKSSKGIYPDMAIQNMAYRQADAITANENRSKGGVIVRLAKTADDPIQFEAVQVPYDPVAWETFLAAGAFWRLWRKVEGKWTGGYATDEEVAVLSKRKPWKKA